MLRNPGNRGELVVILTLVVTVVVVFNHIKLHNCLSFGRGKNHPPVLDHFCRLPLDRIRSQ